MSDDHRVKPDYAESLRFLDWWRPGGPWTLVAIGEGKGITAETFAADQLAELRKWLEFHGSTSNIYFCVNGLLHRVSKKPLREDVASLDWLHVDVDPRAGEDLEQEQKRILAMLQKFSPRPSAIVYSGGGYQAFWRLEESLPIEGKLAVAEDLKRYNLQLESLFSADACHNVDRIMRLPGTINRPDAKKRKKGRTMALARVVEQEDVVYPITAFTKAPQVQGGAAGTVQLDLGNLPEVDLDGWFPGSDADPNAPPLRDHHRELIVRGCGMEVVEDLRSRLPEEVSPEERAKWESWESRSEPQMSATGAMVRGGMTPEQVYAVLVDDRLGISRAIKKTSDDKSRRNWKKYAEKQVRDAMAKVASDDFAGRDDAIFVVGGNLPQVVSRSEEQLLKTGKPIYQRGFDLVTPDFVKPRGGNKTEVDDGVTRNAGSVIIRPLGAHALQLMMAESATYLRKNADGKWICTDPKLEHAKTLLAKRPVPFPYLTGIANAPRMRADGTIVQDEGYDRETGLLLDFNGVQFARVRDAPTREDASAALERVKRPFRSYDFEDPASASVAYSGMLTTTIVQSLPAVPAHVIDSAVAGYGKTKIADCVNQMAAGVPAAVMSQGKSPEEDEKRIGAALRGGDSVLVIDNIERPIQGDLLCSAITQPMISLRPLGQSLVVALPSQVMFMPTGNNVQVRGDMCRRVLQCRIDGGHARPDKREFDFDPVREVETQRGELVVAALTVLRAYVAAGRPMRGEVKPLGSFEDWNIVREALVWLGEADPAETRELVMEADTQLEELREQLAAIRGTVREELFTAKDLRQRAQERSELREALDPGCREVTGHKVRGVINRLRGRVIDGFVLQRVRENDKRGHTYRVHRKRDEAVEPPGVGVDDHRPNTF